MDMASQCLHTGSFHVPTLEVRQEETDCTTSDTSYPNQNKIPEAGVIIT